MNLSYPKNKKEEIERRLRTTIAYIDIIGHKEKYKKFVAYLEELWKKEKGGE